MESRWICNLICFFLILGDWSSKYACLYCFLKWSYLICIPIQWIKSNILQFVYHVLVTFTKEQMAPGYSIFVDIFLPKLYCWRSWFMVIGHRYSRVIELWSMILYSCMPLAWFRPYVNYQMRIDWNIFTLRLVVEYLLLRDLFTVFAFQL